MAVTAKAIMAEVDQFTVRYSVLYNYIIAHIKF